MAKYKWLSDTLCAGLELEYEGTGPDKVVPKYQDTFKKRLLVFGEDGSLRPRRQSIEIKFSGPLSGPLISEALNQIETVHTWHNHRISWRCGMHVHIDCTGVEFSQLYRAAVLTTLIENLLYLWDGTGRQENKFCQSIVDSVYSYLHRPTGAKKVLPNLTKYSLVNLNSLFNRNTLELRFAGSTKNMDLAAEFINLGMGLRNSATEFETAQDLVESVLSAPDLATWLSKNVPHTLADPLVPLARLHGVRHPSIAAMNAATLLADYEDRIKLTVIGGR